MKKAFAALCAVFCLTLCCGAEKVGEVTGTDITAYIDRSPIFSYHFQNGIYVVAEDLINYGFRVEWDGDRRTLCIERDLFVFAPYITGDINREKASVQNEPLHTVCPTDIQTCLDGARIISYNIGGRTIIQIDSLAAYGNCSYDDQNRRYDVNILEKEIEGLVERTDTDRERDTVITQKGVFSDGELQYGIKITRRGTQPKYGYDITTQYGDFKNQRYIKHENAHMGREESLTFYTPRDVRHSFVSDRFRYGLLLSFVIEEGETGNEYRYLRTTGELYLILPKTKRNPFEPAGLSFNGVLFKDGEQIYEGEIMVDSFSFSHGDHRWHHQSGDVTQIKVLYAKGYSDPDGVIYYYDVDFPCYRGNVVNGVAHGKGEMSRGAGDRATGEYAVYMRDHTEYTPYEDPHLIYRGDFINGMFDGTGQMYSGGILIMEGIWKRNKKEGDFLVFRTTTDGNAGSAAALVFEGEYREDKIEGFGVEYDELGWAFYSGIYERFSGEWEGGNWKKGEMYEIVHDGKTNTNHSRLLYDGEFVPIGERAYGTIYSYGSDGEATSRTGYFLDWEYIGE